MTAHYVLGPELEQILRPDDPPAELARAVAKLSDLFNGLAPWQAEYGRDPALRRAYLAYYLPVNLPKLAVPLARWLALRPGAFAGRPLRVVDLGSGPGTMLLGLCDFVTRLPENERPTALELVAIDEHAENLRDASRLVAELERIDPRVPPVRFEALRLDVVADRRDLFPLAVARGRFDLAILANVLCEVAGERAGGNDPATALVEAVAADLLAPTGAIVVIEPALRRTARDLEQVRDRLLTECGLVAVAPCLDQGPCPALLKERDWCVSALAWEPPRWIAEIDRRIGLRKEALKLAYLVLAKEPLPPPGSGVWQVVSDVLDLKGELRIFLCGEGRWLVVRHLKRRGREIAAELRRLRRGDLVEVAGLVAKGALFEPGPDARFRRLG